VGVGTVGWGAVVVRVFFLLVSSLLLSLGICCAFAFAGAFVVSSLPTPQHALRLVIEQTIPIIILIRILILIIILITIDSGTAR
jgi:hypothetical protein